MSNIVSTVAQMAGGIDRLAQLHQVSYQAVWLWKKNGYFPLKQIEIVLANFPKVTEMQLFAAYYAYKKKTVWATQPEVTAEQLIPHNPRKKTAKRRRKRNHKKATCRNSGQLTATANRKHHKQKEKIYERRTIKDRAA